MLLAVSQRPALLITSLSGKPGRALPGRAMALCENHEVKTTEKNPHTGESWLWVSCGAKNSVKPVRQLKCGEHQEQAKGLHSLLCIRCI